MLLYISINFIEGGNIMNAMIPGKYGKTIILSEWRQNSLWAKKRIVRLPNNEESRDFQLYLTTNNIDNSLSELSFEANLPDEETNRWDYSIILKKDGNEHQITRMLLGSVAILDSLHISKDLYDMLATEIVRMCDPNVEFNINDLINLLHNSQDPSLIEWLNEYERQFCSKAK